MFTESGKVFKSSLPFCDIPKGGFSFNQMWHHPVSQIFLSLWMQYLDEEAGACDVSFVCLSEVVLQWGRARLVVPSQTEL